MNPGPGPSCDATAFLMKESVTDYSASESLILLPIILLVKYSQPAGRNYYSPLSETMFG